MAMGLRSNLAGYGSGSGYYAHLFQEKEVVVNIEVDLQTVQSSYSKV